MAYEDLNTKFVANTNTSLTEIYPTVDGMESVIQGLERLLTTPKGHDPFNREYGASLYSLLFESEAALSAVQMFLYMDITKWEPRVNISPAGIEISRVDNNTFIVECNFTLNGYETPISLSTTISKE